MTFPVQQTRECENCGAELTHVRGTIVLALRCPDCRAGGEVVLDATGQSVVAAGPAVGPPALATDGGTLGGNHDQ